jgi:xylulokinase
VFSQYNDAIREVPDGSGGLIFLPYLNGERTPYWDANARGVFFGVNLATAKPHFIKAVMEGVSFALRNCVETAESLGLKIRQIQAVGGGIKSEIWLSTLGKIMKIPLRTVARPDTTLLGSMLLCARGLGALDSIEQAVERIVTYDREIHYPASTPVYEKQYALFLSLYDRLAPAFEELAAVPGADEPA